MKRLCLLFFVTIIANIAQAQIGYGPEGGISYCQFKTLPASTYSVTQQGIIGYNIGGALDVPMNDNYYFNNYVV